MTTKIVNRCAFEFHTKFLLFFNVAQLFMPLSFPSSLGGAEKCARSVNNDFYLSRKFQCTIFNLNFICLSAKRKKKKKKRENHIKK